MLVLKGYNIEYNNLLLTAGSQDGLRITVNIETYEYMTGPHSDTGVKVSPTFNTLQTHVNGMILNIQVA